MSTPRLSGFSMPPEWMPHERTWMEFPPANEGFTSDPERDLGPSVTVDMSRLSKLLKLDETSRLATFGAGVSGPDLEAQLRAHGLILGHFPQSFEYSTLGGWIATRSSGQQSALYGRIEKLFADRKSVV